ncbi:DNA polymerase III subunit gamma and tau [Nocardiopsis potens]|uniref:DNA polymerase III subunit gamma and tau n=1 Tax=Nocardiopsis potens TaxID=1246458 RepID=UPI00034CBDF5|nr:DNA polymerase III subunit gamma and tau [Nocardiopsis potens]
MSIALYRKYRPATFGEVRGQEHVTDPLRQALRNGRINHAYLFSGPRGCGKTSSARILARSLNCDQGPTPDPCGQCESCVALAPDGPGSIDVIEIDAASHGGVDDARDLRERAFFAPVNSRYKVYIIDEAHMVTREGFNALLKLVEEPPPHLKFVFATTEPDKVIGTIRSRTHHYPFRLIPPSTLRELMEEILTQEGVAYDPAALPLVVRAGAGSARDSLSILDQLLAGSDEQGITRDGAVALLGYTDSSLLSEMVDAVGARDGAAAFGLIDRVMEGGHDPRRFTADLLERVRDLVVLGAVPDALDKGLINVSPDAVDAMRDQASRLGPAQLTRAAEVLNQGLTEMRGATSPRLLLELLCARILLPGADGEDGAALLARVEQLERRGPAGPAPAVQQPPAQQPPAPAAVQRPAPPAAQAPPPAAPVQQRPEPAPAPAPAPQPAPAEERSAPPAPGGDDWPEAVRPGQGAPPAPEPEPAPAPAAAAASAPSGGPIDIGALQASWGQVMEAVKGLRRFTWMMLSGNGIMPVGVEGGMVQLGFPRPNEAKGFANSGSDKIVATAIKQVFGVEVRVGAVPAGGASAPRPPAQQAPQPQRQAPPAPEPAPAAGPSPAAQQARRIATGLEEPPPDPYENAVEPDLPPEPDVPDPENDLDADDGPPPSAYALIESELGGKVIDEIDHT